MSGGPPTVGLWGKLPARGDFVRAGLPRDFTDPWDAWWQRQLAGLERAQGAGWIEAWLEAPVWRFSLAAGICGAAPVLGLWMPSVDRAGRYFPLTIAAVGAACWDRAFLDAAEEAGRDAVAIDLAPEAVLDRLAAPGEDGVKLAAGTAWATEGNARVAAGRCRFPTLPEGSAFRDMVDAAPDGAAPA